jgi:hypothetical protein
MRPEQFPFGQPVEKRRVLLVTVNVINFEVSANRQRIDREYLRATFDLRQFGVGTDVRRRRGFGRLLTSAATKVVGLLHGRSRIETVT